MYGSVAGVTALVPSIDSIPTSGQIGQWLSEGGAIIDRYLAGGGYVVPVLVAALLYPELTGLNNLYAAAYSLRSQNIDIVSGGEQDRSETWLREFYARLAVLSGMDLTGLGVTILVSSSRSIFRVY